MYPFASYVLGKYYLTTGWNEDNLYSNLTRSSNAILDFTVPKGLHFTISKSPNASFCTSYSMNAMKSLNGSVGYIFSSCALDIASSKDVRFKDVIERFKIYDQPRRPESQSEERLAEKKADIRSYLLYGRLYLPTGRLDALYSTRISPTLQAVVAAISDPRVHVQSERKGKTDHSSNLMLSLQHDIGSWCTEYTWSAEDNMWGIRSLYNFATPAKFTEHGEEGERIASKTTTRLKRVDEEDAVEAGLRGRVSVGAELYLSTTERSAGVSTGIRFTTLPDATPLSSPHSSSPTSLSHSVAGLPSQTPTTITALFNPMMGHISTAYAAQVSDNLSLASRFDFNFYSYESEWTMGAEWWMRRAGPNPDLKDRGFSEEPPPPPDTSDVRGVVKARVSTKNTVSLMWEGRLKNVLASLGVLSDFSSRAKPIKAVGLELSYFSSD